jgi:hypothetical protein
MITFEVRDDRAADLKTEGDQVSGKLSHCRAVAIATTALALSAVAGRRRAAGPGMANPPPPPGCRPSTLAAQ